MNLMPKEIAKNIPTIGAQDGKGEDAVVYLKIFDPCGRLTFFATEFDGEDTLFGYMISPLGPDCDEWGYSSLSELQSVRNPLGLPLERDRSFNPVPLAQAKLRLVN